MRRSAHSRRRRPEVSKYQVSVAPFENVFTDAHRLLSYLCRTYRVPNPNIIFNEKFLQRIQALGMYYPEIHLVVLRRPQLVTKAEVYAVVHEWQHHAFHAAHHR